MTTHTTADAFVRKLLERPTDATARLVFADWLEETGDKRNTAWAYYMRLRTEADRYPHNSAERAELERQAANYTKHIRAELALPAAKFVGYPKSLLQLLPAPNITVRLDGFDTPLSVVEMLPESVAREKLLFPLDHQPGTLLLAAAEPGNADTIQKLQFILNRDIVLVRGDDTDIQDAIDRTFGATETLSVESVTYEYPLILPPELSPTDPQVVQLASELLNAAVALRADRVRVLSEVLEAVIECRVNGQWVVRDRIAKNLVRPLAAQYSLRAGYSTASLYVIQNTDWYLAGSIEFAIQSARFRSQFDVTRSNDGLGIQLTIEKLPPE